MRRVCAWCGKILEAGDPRTERTTHGVCKSCARILEPDPRSGAASVPTARAAKVRAGKSSTLSRSVRFAPNQRADIQNEN